MNEQECHFIVIYMVICATKIQRIVVKLFNFFGNRDILYAEVQYK